MAAAPRSPDLAGAERQAGLLAAACDLAQAGLNSTAVLEVVARAASNLVGDCGYVRLVSKDGEFADLVAFYHRDPVIRQAMGKQFSQHRLKAGECYLGHVVQTGKSLCVPDTGVQEFAYRACPDHQEFAARVGIRGVALAPLVSGERVLGVLGATRFADSPLLAPDDLRVLEALASLAGPAIANADEHGIVRERVRSLADEAATARAEAANRRGFIDNVVSRIPGFLIYADRNMVVRWANHIATTLLGRRVLGRQLSRVLPAALLSPLGEALENKVAVTATAVGIGAEAGGSEGPRMVWDVSVCPLTSKGNALGGVAVIGMDVRDRIECNRLRLARMEIMKQVDVLKDDVVNVLSHELRTPLHAIIGWGALLEDDPSSALGPDQAGYLGSIVDSAYDLIATVDKLIDYSQLQAGKLVLRLEAVYLPDIVEAVVSKFAPLAAKRRIRVNVDVPDLQQIVADGPRVEQILSNLLDNAVKFSREGGEISIRALSRDGQVLCEVKDDGPGICDEDISRIFEPLLQLEPSMTRSNRGTGLGLFLSKALTDAQGGTIGVTKGDSGGTVFWFTMPVWDPASSNGSASVIVVDSPSL